MQRGIVDAAASRPPIHSLLLRAAEIYLNLIFFANFSGLQSKWNHHGSLHHCSRCHEAPTQNAGCHRRGLQLKNAGENPLVNKFAAVKPLTQCQCCLALSTTKLADVPPLSKDHSILRHLHPLHLPKGAIPPAHRPVPRHAQISLQPLVQKFPRVQRIALQTAAHKS